MPSSIARAAARTFLLVSLLLPLAAVAEPASDADEAGPAEPAIASLPAHVAELTRTAVEGFIAQLSAAAEALGAAETTGPAVDWERVGMLAANLAVVIAATIILFAVLRWLSRAPVHRLGEWAARADGQLPVVRRAVAVVGASLLNGIAIAIAWVVGHVVALYLTGPPGELSTDQSLFLNAFLGIELLKILVRVLLSSRHAGVRLLPLADGDAAYWDRRLARLIDFGGYGLLFAVPVVETGVAPVIGVVLSLLVTGLALVYAVVIIRQNRAPVRERLDAVARASTVTVNRVVIATLARTWHWLAIAYFVALAIAIETGATDMLPFMALATLQSVIALGIGLALYATLSHLVGRRVPLPETARARLPRLEQRLEGYARSGLHVLRLAVGVVIIAALLDAWSLFDLDAWLTSDAGTATLAALVSVGFIVLLAALVWVVFATWIDHRIGGDGEAAAGSRERTLLTLFRNAAAIVLIVMTVMISLSEIGIEIGPLLAGAGVLGLAIGFGAQTLVQDIITGVFIQLENAINTDDVITVGGVTGVVERLSIRSVGVRDLSGTFHIVPFSQVGTVSNYMRGFAYHVGEYGIAYREDSDQAIECLKAAFAELREDPEMGPAILDELEVHGVTALADSSVNVRVRIKTQPGMQWSVGRAYNRLVKRHLDAAGIEIPFPHLTLYFGADQEGNAPPANVRVLEGASSRVADDGDSSGGR